MWIGWLVVGAVCSLVLGLDLELVFIVGWLGFWFGCVLIVLFNLRCRWCLCVLVNYLFRIGAWGFL